tara:strand:+ start:995 stop:2020 length:1026 start_codon:yes stop_codon:yes gene_type:complete
MAFLDNSGDIILDAVLTDLGRKRMAQGNFRINKFALGDDEIAYNLYNKDHPSGSAYYDLEILQTPVLEAFTATNANINYGLLSYTNTDLLYLPVLVENKVCNASPLLRTGSVYHVAANNETYDKLASANGIFKDAKYVASAGSTTSNRIIIESGFNTTELVADQATQNGYLIAGNLIDNTFNVYFDNRFVSAPMGPKAAGGKGSIFKNNSSTGADETSFSMENVTANSTAGFMDNYSTATVKGILNQVYYNTVFAEYPAITALQGPRGTATALNFNVDTGLTATATGTRDSKYTLYGKTDQTFSGYASQKYDYVDTVVFLQGSTTSMQIQLPIRIIRYAGT